MSIKIYQPVSFSEKGNRPNNEDCVFPQPGFATVADRLFLVCDGVGGEHKGEVASAEACRCLSDYLKNHTGVSLSPEEMNQILTYTCQSFAEIERNDPETHGMATTLTLLYLLDTHIVLAHLGDSRIYQVRDGKIVFQTRDHKLVNELVEGGVITEEQAREHPKKNVITRVIQASRQDQADFKIIDDIRPGDFFFLCTDGVLERLYDGLLEYHLGLKSGSMATPSELMVGIKEECEGMTNDNFSAYLIQIDSVEGNLPEATVAESEKTLKLSSPLVHTETVQKSNGLFFTLATLIGLLLFGATAYYLIHRTQENSSNPDSLSKVIPDSPPLLKTPQKSKPRPQTEEALPLNKKPILKEIKQKNTESSNSLPVTGKGKKFQKMDTVQTAKQRFPDKALSDTIGSPPKQSIKTEQRILLKRERDSIPTKKSND